MEECIHEKRDLWYFEWELMLNAKDLCKNKFISSYFSASSFSFEWTHDNSGNDIDDDISKERRCRRQWEERRSQICHDVNKSSMRLNPCSPLTLLGTKKYRGNFMKYLRNMKPLKFSRFKWEKTSDFLRIVCKIFFSAFNFHDSVEASISNST